jgi:hypothetical protein
MRLIAMEVYPVRNEYAAYRVIDGLALVVHPDGKLLTLNKVGSLIWELADGSNTLDVIVEKVCQEFDVDATRAGKEARDFIDKLVAKKLVTLAGAPASTAIEK